MNRLILVYIPKSIYVVRLINKGIKLLNGKEAIVTLKEKKSAKVKVKKKQLADPRCL